MINLNYYMYDKILRSQKKYLGKGVFTRTYRVVIIILYDAYDLQICAIETIRE